MLPTRSMDPKVKIKNFPLSNDALASTSKRPSSSFFLATIISLLEILIKFKYSPDFLQTFSKSFKTLLKKAKKYISSHNLNQDILNNFNKILKLLQNTQDPITAFQYLSFYSESQELDCSITLEYTMRFIFAALICDEDSIEESVIIEDKGIRSSGKVLEKLTLELPINVVFFSGTQKQCFLNKRIKIKANIFLMKEENKFWIVYPRECWEIMRVFPGDKSEIEKFPHIYCDERNSFDFRLNQRENFIEGGEERKNAFDSGCVKKVEKFDVDAKDIDGRQQILEDNLKASSNYKNSSEQRSSLYYTYEQCVDPASDNQELKKPDTQLDPNSSLYLNQEEIKIDHDLTLQNQTLTLNMNLSSCSDSENSSSLITLSKRKILRILKLLNKRIKHDLSESFKTYLDTNFIKHSICMKDFSSFLNSCLPTQNYKRRSIKRLALSLHRPLDSVKIKENVYWEIIINLEIDPILEFCSKTDFIRVLIKCIKYLIQIRLQSKILIKT